MNFNVECNKCNNFGHKSCAYRSILEPTKQNMKQIFFLKHEEEKTRVWKRKSYLQKKEERNLALHAQSKTSQWYIDSGCSKHMTRDQRSFLVLKREKEGNVTSGNDGSTKINKKGISILGNEKAKVQNVLLIENMKHNLLGVS